MSRLFTTLLIAAMILGIGVGWACHQGLDAAHIKQVADGLAVLTDMFLRLIKMIIAVLVFTTLVSGIAHMEDAGAVGRVGAKTMLWFVSASLVSLLIGLLMVHLIQPGAGLNLTPPPVTAKSGVEATSLTVSGFLTHLIPTSIVKAMADNEILQVVVFSLFFGTAIAAVPGRAPALMGVIEQAAQVMLKVTGYVMRAAPVAVFAALASTVATQGMSVLTTYAKFVGGFYLSLGVLWAVLFGACFVVIGPRVVDLFKAIRAPTLIAFSTASSEAAYPRILEGLERFGVSPKVASFVLPLGYSFNLDGSTMYCTFATLFVAQVYGIHLSLGQQVTMLLLLMVTSKGMAGVPRASLVVIAATLPTFNLPEAGLVLIIAVDHLLDMGRSATNVVGNSVASAVVAKWEGQLGPPVPLFPAPVKAEA
jgi:Na+/H+-dicarboxylate symporter